MADKRSQSRGRANSAQNAAEAAGSVQGPSLSEASRNAFARGGQFTGRDAGDGDGATEAVSSAQVAAGDAPSGVSVAAEQYEQVVAERDEYRADLQRLAAEFDNFRKRSIREREQAASAADAKLLVDLLGVLDDFERAMEQGASEQSPLLEGITMVHSRLDATLRQQGLELIDTSGPFDPALHEAVLLQPAENAADGTILHVAQKGYRIGDRVIRHARVVVAGTA